MTDSIPNPDLAESASAPKPLWKRLLPLGVIGVVLAVFFATGANEYLSLDSLQDNQAALKDFARDNLFLAMAAVIAVYALCTAISFPGASALTLLSGFVLGTVFGGISVVIGATIGATIIFLAARNAAGDTLVKRGGKLMKKMEAGFKEDAWSYMLILRLVPLFPFWLVNIAPAAFRVPTLTYVWTTFVGIMPGTFVYASLGAGVSSIADAGSINFGDPSVFGPILGLIALSLIPLIYKRFAKKSNTVEA